MTDSTRGRGRPRLTKKAIVDGATKLHALTADSGGAIGKFVFYDKKGGAVGALICLIGAPETGEVLSAIENVEGSWR